MIEIPSSGPVFRQVPVALWRLVLMVSSVVCFALLMLLPMEHWTASFPARAPFWSAEYVLGWLSMGLLAVPVVAWFLPRAGSWLGLLMLLMNLPAFRGAVPSLVVVLVTALVVLAGVVWDFTASRHQRLADAELVRDRPALPEALVHSPGVRDAPAFWGSRWLGWALLAVGALGCVTLLWWHQNLVREVQAYEAVALRRTATVVRPDFDEGVVIRLDGREHQVHSAIGDYETGEQVEVMLDPADPQHIDLVAEPVDPGWVLGWAPLPLLAGVGAWHRLGRSTRRRRLLHSGEPGLTLSWSLVEGAPMLVDGGEPVALLWNLEPASPEPGQSDRSHADQTPWDWDHVDSAALTDEELSALGDQELGIDEDEEEPFGWPMGPLPEPVVVHGRLAIGAPVLLQDLAGGLHAAELGDPWPRERLVDRVQGRLWHPEQAGSDHVPERAWPSPSPVPATFPAASPQRSSGQEPPELTDEPGWLPRLQRRWGPRVVWPVSLAFSILWALIGRWTFLVDGRLDGGWGSLLPLLVVGSLAVAWPASTVADLAECHELGLRLRGSFLDRVLTRAEVARVLAGKGSVTLGLKDGGVVTIDPAAVVDPDRPDVLLGAEQARAVVQGWIDDSPVGARGSTLVAPGLAALVLWAVLTAWWLIPAL